MKLKYFMRGIGVGIVATTLIISLTQDKVKKVEMTDNEIMQAAKELGMVMSESVNIDYESIRNTMNQKEEVPEDSSDVKDSDTGNSEQVSQGNNGSELSVEESETDSEKNSEIDTELDSDLNSEDGNGNIETGTNEDELSDEDNSNSNESDSNSSESDTSTNANEDNLNQSDGNNLDENDTGVNQNQGDYAIITVESGMYSSDVSELLEEAKIIENSKEFSKFLSRNGYSTKLIAGSHKIPYGATYQEIAKILMDRNK